MENQLIYCRTEKFRNSNPQEVFLMTVERTKPKAVKGPKEAPLEFWARQILDLQLKTIVDCLSKKLPQLTGKVLDIGAGESPWKYLLGRDTIYQGIDIQSAEEFGMIKSRDVIYYDGLTIPFPSNEFDAGLCIEVLEHAKSPQVLLSEAFRVLKPGGKLVITVPWSARVHHIPFDYHRFTPFQLQHLMEQAGFSECQIQARGNNICSIANKMTLIAWTLFSPSKKISYLWCAPLMFLVILVCIPFLVIAHLSLFIRNCSSDDPLGYFVEVVK
jgi:ubiquinone/menaquinone biosynthesis C-methylase UbiE